MGTNSNAVRNERSAEPKCPHSWDLPMWPGNVWPGDSKRARWLVRAYRDELMRYGALSRAGRTLVVIGRGYSAWLEQRASHVPGYLSNNPDMRKPLA
jgi:hypothetical protein